MATTVGLFANTGDAKSAVTELKRLGYQNEEISVLVKDNSSVGAQDNQNAPAAGVATGSVAGGALGALGGLLVGLGLITIPGIGPFVAAGPLLASLGLTGAAATTAVGAATGAVAGGVTGGVVGALSKMGMEKAQAEKYEQRLREGAVLVGVATDRVSAEVARQAMSMFNAEGLQEIT